MNHFIKQDDTSFVILNKFLDKEIDYQINVERLNQLNDELKSAIEMIDYLKKENKTLKNELIKQQESIKYTSDKSYNDGKNLN